MEELLMVMMIGEDFLALINISAFLISTFVLMKYRAVLGVVVMMWI